MMDDSTPMLDNSLTFSTLAMSILVAAGQQVVTNSWSIIFGWNAYLDSFVSLIFFPEHNPNVLPLFSAYFLYFEQAQLGSSGGTGPAGLG